MNVSSNVNASGSFLTHFVTFGINNPDVEGDQATKLQRVVDTFKGAGASPGVADARSLQTPVVLDRPRQQDRRRRLQARASSARQRRAVRRRRHFDNLVKTRWSTPAACRLRRADGLDDVGRATWCARSDIRDLPLALTQITQARAQGTRAATGRNDVPRAATPDSALALAACGWAGPPGSRATERTSALRAHAVRTKIRASTPGRTTVSPSRSRRSPRPWTPPPTGCPTASRATGRRSAGCRDSALRSARAHGGGHRVAGRRARAGSAGRPDRRAAQGPARSPAPGGCGAADRWSSCRPTATSARSPRSAACAMR